MTLHVAVSGWLLGSPSGANRRLLEVLAHAGEHLQDDERITVLHRREFRPPPLAKITWLPIDIPTGPTWKRALREQSKVPPILRELEATVYEHGFLPPPRLHVPTNLTIHDLRAVDGHTMWPRAFARGVLRKACRRAATIVVPSRFTAARLQDAVAIDPDRIVVAPNAISFADHAPQQPPEPIPANGYLLHVGHLEARKNLDVLVRAVAEMPADQAPEVWLAGQDQGRGSHLRSLARQAGCDDKLKLLGTVDEPTLHALYSHARAVVLPSRYEGFGMPALEGLAYGKPVLAAETSALPEVLGGHGTLLPPDAPAAWAEAIRALPTNGQQANGQPANGPEADEATARRTFANASPSWRDVAATYVATWRRLDGS